MNRDDLGILIERQIPRLRRYAHALMQDRQQADDLVQDCLDQAWRRLHRWQPAQDLRVWLFSILHNLHANSVKAFLPWNSDPTTAATRHRGTWEQGGAADLGAIESGLAQLARDHHEVLVLVCVEEMNYEQAAAVLGVPVGTVIARLHGAREQLRDSMNRERRTSLRRVK